MRRLARTPIVLAAVYLASWLLASWLAPDDRGAIGVKRVESVVSDVLACIGPLVAAAGFGRRDYLRRAWLLYGLSYAFLVPASVFRFLPVTPLNDAIHITSIVLCNVTGM